jgi:hypothetical protein
MSDPQEQPEDSDSGGQVSEVSALRDKDQPISPGDSVAGAPDGESGRPDEGPTGPDAPTYDERQDRHPPKDDVETTG